MSNTNSGAIPLIGEASSINVNRYHTGNRCGHDPANPRWFNPDESHKRRPDIIQYAIANLQRFYVNPSAWLLSLNAVRLSPRQERSEGRERNSEVLGVLLHYTELASLRVGVPLENGTIMSLDMKFIAKKLGWRSALDDKEDQALVKAGKFPKNRGVQRVYRAITKFKEAGYLTVHERFEKAIENDAINYSGLPAVKVIHAKLFYELGISAQKLSAKRQEASRRLKQKLKSYNRGTQGKLAKQAHTIANKIFKNTTRKSNSNRLARYSQERRVEQERARQRRCIELIQLSENNNLSSEEFYKKYPELQHPDMKQQE